MPFQKPEHNVRCTGRMRVSPRGGGARGTQAQQRIGDGRFELVGDVRPATHPRREEGANVRGSGGVKQELGLDRTIGR